MASITDGAQNTASAIRSANSARPPAYPYASITRCALSASNASNARRAARWRDFIVWYIALAKLASSEFVPMISGTAACWPSSNMSMGCAGSVAFSTVGMNAVLNCTTSLPVSIIERPTRTSSAASTSRRSDRVVVRGMERPSISLRTHIAA